MLAILVGYSVEGLYQTLLVVGLAVLSAGAWTTRRAQPFIVKSMAAAPGAILVAVSLPEPVPPRVGVLVFGAIVLFGPTAEGFDGRAPRLAAPFLLVAVVGIYICVPETNAVRPLPVVYMTAR